MKNRNPNNYARAALLLGCAVVFGVSGCRIHVDKDAAGKEKDVQVDTPFGGMHVNTDQTTASDLGLPVYPGAQEVKGDDEHKSADVHMGFGEWQLRVKAVSYESVDSKEKVAAFYKKALERFGDVVTCEAGTPVGTPTVTHDGLSCSDDDKNNNVNVNHNDWKNGLELKAGSRRHQQIVGFEEPKKGQTRFARVALDLPAGMTNDDGKKD